MGNLSSSLRIIWHSGVYRYLPNVEALSASPKIAVRCAGPFESFAVVDSRVAKTLTILRPPLTSPVPPRELGEHGLKLWRSVTAEYDLNDAGGTELLAQACTALDRAEALAECVKRDGVLIDGKNGPKAHPAIKEELAARAFVCRTLQRLGINVEPVKSPGRPGGSHPSWMGNP